MKHKRQWFIRVPWGKLYLKSRGHPDGIPVFLVHGRQDSGNVFEPLIDQMSEQYYYVALDMPGNGLSDAFPKVTDVPLRDGDPNYAMIFNRPPDAKRPFVQFNKICQGLEYKTKRPGPKLMRFHFLYPMELALMHLGWDRFIFMGHSMGCEQGLFYNIVHPGQIMQMILLDAGPTLMRMQVEDNAEFQKAFYDYYYENYHRENCVQKVHTIETATRALQRTRDLSDPQCAFLLERNFHELNWHPMQSWHPNELRIAALKLSQDAIEAQNSNEAQNEIEVLNANEAPNSDETPNKNDSTNADTLNINEDLNLNAPTELPEDIKRMQENGPVGFLSWDNRLKSLAPQNYGNDYYFQLFKTIPPTLLIAASEGTRNAPTNPKWRQGAKELLDKMATLDNFHKVDVEGSHDVHYSHPERVLPHINKFLKYNNTISSKL